MIFFERMDNIGGDISYEDMIRKEVSSIRREHNLPDTDVESTDVFHEVFDAYSRRSGQRREIKVKLL